MDAHYASVPALRLKPSQGYSLFRSPPGTEQLLCARSPIISTQMHRLEPEDPIQAHTHERLKEIQLYGSWVAATVQVATGFYGRDAAAQRP